MADVNVLNVLWTQISLNNQRTERLLTAVTVGNKFSHISMRCCQLPKVRGGRVVRCRTLWSRVRLPPVAAVCNSALANSACHPSRVS